MKKICNIFVLAFLIIFALNCASRAENIDAIMDKFYDGLADIIERNMDSPDQCVREINDYYRDNQATTEKIRKMMEKGMAQVGAMMKQYEHTHDEQTYMTDDDIEAMERRARLMGMTRGVAEEPAMSPGAERYAKALEAFTVKYPLRAMGITMKAMELMPTGKRGE